MNNIFGRDKISLNGKWQCAFDPSNSGEYRKIFKEHKALRKEDFFESSFEGGPTLNVPGDFNTQYPELFYYEGTIWYKKAFDCIPENGKRYFLHFGAVNYKADIYFNENKIGSHEGGFTPFQVEITKLLKQGNNSLIVKVNNSRDSLGIPGSGFDWFNYGGITRDVDLVKTDKSYIEDYLIQLKKGSLNEVDGWVKMAGCNSKETISIAIPELRIKYQTSTDSNGIAKVSFKGKFINWEPSNPKLYKVIISSSKDRVEEQIGFRCIEVKGNQILLNKKPIFLKGINMHEENPIRGARAFGEQDALMLLSMAKEAGCNMIRLAHYPYNEYMLRMAEKQGFLIWSEIPVYQHIVFSNPSVVKKMRTMFDEELRRDKNRACIFIWSLSNETYDWTPNRNKALHDFIDYARSLDSTRLITSVSCTQGYDNNTFNICDPLYDNVDVVAVNEYLGWYSPFKGKPAEVKWKFRYSGKPMIISEFGGEALYGSNFGPKDEADSWSEEYQEQIYKNQIEMFKNTPNLVGTCPWILSDFRSPGRMQPVKQGGWNRKGIYSDRGEKKKAFYVLKQWYDSIKAYPYVKK
jgi:beta-glucuronidase